ncbi:unnamed protein product [Rhizophagus irregularis]|nr:unnamed protein product [Rhizophagus irregularis]CAB5390922.1 unnamed protein product [Rhizophagus irregularis]
MSRAQQQFIPGPLPRPAQLRRNMTILSYDVYCHPVFPVNHPDFGRTGAWCRQRLRNRLQRLGWRLNVQYSVVSRNIAAATALHQVRFLKVHPTLYWMAFVRPIENV